MNKACRILVWSLFVLLICVSNSVDAQTEISERSKNLGAKILKTGLVADVLPYLAALENIDLNKYRLLDATRVLKFESGFEIELISGQAFATEQGKSIAPNLTAEADFKENPGMILQLHSSGRILEKHFKRVVK